MEGRTYLSKNGKIRVLALAIFRHKDRILVFKGHDSQKNQDFYRPLGGGVEFGETTKQALRREIKEELRARISKPLLLGIAENIFEYEGEKGHEIIYLYETKFKDKSFYCKKKLDAYEGENDQIHFVPQWVKLSDIETEQIPLYPDGLLELLMIPKSKGG